MMWYSDIGGPCYGGEVLQWSEVIGGQAKEALQLAERQRLPISNYSQVGKSELVKVSETSIINIIEYLKKLEIFEKIEW